MGAKSEPFMWLGPLLQGASQGLGWVGLGAGSGSATSVSITWPPPYPNVSFTALLPQSVEQRRREAVGPLPHDALHIVLLKHRVLGLWPANEAQQFHFQRVLGLLPPPPEVGGWACSCWG